MPSLLFLSRFQRTEKDCFIYRASEDSFEIRTGDWFITVKTAPAVGQIVFVRNLQNADEAIARYEVGNLRLPDGTKLKTAQWQLVGVIKPLDRFICDSFPIEHGKVVVCPN